MIELDAEKTFDILFDILKESYRELFSLGFGITGAVLVVLGWFATEENPLSFLCGPKWPTYAALFGVALGYSLIFYLFTIIARRSDSIYNQLVTRGFDKALFERYRITRSMLVGGLVNQTMILGGVFAYILYNYGMTYGLTCQ